MGETTAGNGWGEVLDFPLTGRKEKPRTEGLTMVIDKGLGLSQTAELLEVAGRFIDFIKLGFGTSALYSHDLLARKIELVTCSGADILPGGTFLEIAWLQGKLKEFLQQAREMGYTVIEVSDGTVTMPPQERSRAIQMALDGGFKVLTEIGKKHPQDRVATLKLQEQVWRDLEDGALKVIVEGRESGQGVVIYDDAGAIKVDELEALVRSLSDPRVLIWEAPRKSQQLELIVRFGANVNLGNIQPPDVLALEALRRGLRSDTLRECLPRRAAGVAAGS
ncbi:MAG: phosphosulfolactate synthase [Clostridia bacterium]|nr:MAG: phosphosulfolactate synthase [Clostridia bacterium]